MEPTRREACLIAAAAMIVAGPAAAAEPAPPVSGPASLMRVFHIQATPDGASRLSIVHVKSSRVPLPIASALAVNLAKGIEDWHRPPFRTFTINVSGTIRVELADGTHQMIGPGDLVFLDDLSGRGHVTRLLSDVAALFLRVPDDFDLHAWASA